MADTVTAQAVFDALLGDGMTHIVGVPDNGTAEIFALAAEHGDVGLLTVTREGEALAVASGLWIGGKEPVVVIQNTGLLESGDSLRLVRVAHTRRMRTERSLSRPRPSLGQGKEHTARDFVSFAAHEPVAVRPLAVASCGVVRKHASGAHLLVFLELLHC